MTYTNNIPEVHIASTEKTNPTSKRRYQCDMKTRPPSPTRTFSRGTQTVKMSDNPSTVHMVHRTLSPAAAVGRKGRSNNNARHRAEVSHRNDKYPRKSMLVTTTTKLHEADTTVTTAEIMTNSTIAAKHSPAILTVGNIVGISQSDATERLAMISEMTSFHDSKIVVVCAWLYTRAEINEDLIDVADFSPEESHEHLQTMWPILNKDGTLVTASGRSQCDYMVSTKRTIIVSDVKGTSFNRVPLHVATRVCRDAIYHADSAERRICDVNEGSFYWLKKIL